MRKINYLWAVLACCGMLGVYSCEDNAPAATVAVPTGLNVESITMTSAKLGWTGDADSFEVKLGTSTNQVGTNYWTATGLTADTDYTWQVRAVKGDNASVWVDGPAFTTLSSSPEPPASARVDVNFGNGEEQWKAGYTDCAIIQHDSGDYLEEYLYIFFSKIPEEQADEDFIPAIEAVVKASAETFFLFTEEYDNCYFEYFSEKYWDGRAMADETYLYGDWEVSEGKVTITSYDNFVVSGSVDMTMLDAFDYWVNENDNPAEKSLTVTFSNIPVERETRSVYKAPKFLRNAR